MKVNAPEKIYLQEPTKVRTQKMYDNDVEYIRSDVFIDKALKFIKTNVDRIVNNQHGVCMGCMDWDFRKYMEE